MQADGVDFYVEIIDEGGPQPVGLDRVLSFDAVRETVRAVGEQLSSAWKTVRPSEASVEFGLALTVKAGKLTGLLVDADGNASLKVTLIWKDPDGVAGGS